MTFSLKLINLIDLFIFSNTKLGHVSNCRGKKEIENRIEAIMGHTIHNCLVYNNNVFNTRVNGFFTNDDMHLDGFSYADNNVQRMSTDSQDTALLTNNKGGDLTALETNYH